ncbi:hypothetical protein [Streptomyces beihaiensis]|uniref:Uncharacterized protein n=1 Tax=Streptomyces beihaiensis TaxID=2984495 RepID=A0ABT3TXX1_9ACTN|nr:hypothetical protein [Streptomyces beihaiensis]MCX3061893.1 hypothetical protein [Streptomyces beihaiensis]
MSTVPPPERPDERPEGESSAPETSGAPGVPEVPDISGISDEQWEAFQRDAMEEGGRGAPKEPSARARLVARRLREQDEAAASEAARKPHRRWGRKPKLKAVPDGTPPGWRTGPAWQEMNGKAGRRRNVRSAALVLLAVAVAVVAVRPSLVTDRLPGHDTAAAADTADGPTSSPSPLPAETALPSSAPGTADQAASEPTRAHPFLGSPAARWADGADAIQLPAAKAVGGMTERDVARALRLTKEFLVDTNLNPAVLRGGTPTKAMALLDPKQPHSLSRLRRSLRSPSRAHDPTELVSRFDPAQVALAGKVIKVRGHMTFSAGRAEVLVHADYSFVYPLVRAGSGTDASDHVERTTVRREETFSLADPRKWDVTRGTLLLQTYDSDAYNSECEIYDGYYHPAFPGQPSGAPATGPASDPYDRSKTLEEEQKKEGPGVCGTVTRT